MRLGRHDMGHLCLCQNCAFPPSRTGFLSLVRVFYATGAIMVAFAAIWKAARLGPGELPIREEDPGPCLEGRAGWIWQALAACHEHAARTLEALFVRYLAAACWREAGHLYHRAQGEERTVLMNRYKYLDEQSAPCPFCDREQAIKRIELARYAFQNLTWERNYGGDAWLWIAGVLLEHLIGDGEADMTRDAWVDHVLDLQHNTGSVLNKGWLAVNEDSLKWTLDAKRSADPWRLAVDWGFADWADALARQVGIQVPLPKRVFDPRDAGWSPGIGNTSFYEEGKFYEIQVWYGRCTGATVGVVRNGVIIKSWTKAVGPTLSDAVTVVRAEGLGLLLACQTWDEVEGWTESLTLAKKRAQAKRRARKAMDRAVAQEYALNSLPPRPKGMPSMVSWWGKILRPDGSLARGAYWSVRYAQGEFTIVVDHYAHPATASYAAGPNPAKEMDALVALCTEIGRLPSTAPSTWEEAA